MEFIDVRILDMGLYWVQRKTVSYFSRPILKWLSQLRGYVPSGFFLYVGVSTRCHTASSIRTGLLAWLLTEWPTQKITIKVRYSQLSNLCLKSNSSAKAYGRITSEIPTLLSWTSIKHVQKQALLDARSTRGPLRWLKLV